MTNVKRIWSTLALDLHTLLTCALETYVISLLMRFARPILIAVLGVAFSAYGFDCSPMMTPDQAMQCCDSMNCSHGDHGKDCCQATPSTHAPFVQAASVHGASFTPLVFAVLPVSVELPVIHSAGGLRTFRSHDPPVFYSSPPRPLRI